MNIVSIPLDMIEVGDRLREIDNDHAQLIAFGFERDGQRTPIEVRAPKKAGGRYRLIAGAHRIAAARLAGLREVVAIVLQVTDLEAQLLEVDENLMRHELTPLDRSVFLARRQEIWEQLHPETKHGGDRRSDQVAKSGDLIARFSVEAAEKLGFSERSIQRSVSRYRNLTPEARRLIAGTWIARSGSQLDALGRLEPALQLEVARKIASNELLDDIRDVATIVRQLTNRPVPDAPSAFEKFLGIWRKAGRRDREDIIEHLMAEGFVSARVEDVAA